VNSILLEGRRRIGVLVPTNKITNNTVACFVYSQYNTNNCQKIVLEAIYRRLCAFERVFYG
jgi:hypothetical protein